MLEKLLKLKAQARARMKEICSLCESEERAMTDDEVKEFEQLKADYKSCESQIALLQGIDTEDEDEGNSGAPARVTTPRTVAASKEAPRVIPGPEAKKEFESLGEFLAVCAFNPNDSRLEFQEYKSEQSMGTGTKGGFMVPRKFVNELKSKDPAAGLVRPRAMVMEAGDPPDAEVTIPALDQEPDSSGNHKVYGGVTVSKVEEGGTKPSTDFDLRMISLKPYEVAAIIAMTDKLLRNWRSAGSYAADLLRKAVMGWEDEQFLTGNGVGGPAGTIDAAGAYAVNRAGANAIAFGDIKDMYSRFRGNEARGVWAASYSAFEKLLDMTGDGGGATNVISVDRSTGSVTMYGMPVVRHPRLRALGSKGDLMLSSFEDYAIKDGSGPIVEIGYATGNFEANKRSVKVTWNVDGKMLTTKPYKDEEEFEVSSCVVLDVPAGS